MSFNPSGPSLRVLVTGAAGLLGGEVTGLLTARGHAVVALLHRGNTLVRGGQVLPAAPWAGQMPPPGATATLAGDLRHPSLGLSNPDRRTLAGELDLILHCAALTGFSHDADTYRAVNVNGVTHLLALAERAGPRPIPLLHVSTAYVCGERSGPITEAELDVGQDFANGYEESKAEAEYQVHLAGRRGLPAAIARPSVVVGAWADGAISRFDGLYAMMKLVADGQVRTLPAQPGATLDLVPIDHVAGGLLDIAERMGAAAGQTFHLVSGAPIPIGTLRDLALGYPHFHAPRFVPPQHFDPSRLAAAERGWHEGVAALYGSYFRRDPRFRDDALRRLTGRTCPPIDMAFLRRMIDAAIRAGFLRAGGPAVQRTSG